MMSMNNIFMYHPACLNLITLKTILFLDNYMVNDVRYAWQRNYGVSVLDKELSQYIVTDIKTNEKDVTYSIGNVVIPYINVVCCVGRVEPIQIEI